MTQIDSDAAMAIQPELTSGERLLWAGRPRPGPMLHKEDRYLIPFSLLWGGFAVFWEAGVAGLLGRGAKTTTPWNFGIIWGILFVLIGQYLIWGRFVYAAWKKRRTFYAVTNRRVIVVQTNSNRSVASAYIDTLPALVKERGSGTAGTLRFDQAEPTWSQNRGWSAWDSMAIGKTPAFIDVEDVDGLYRFVAELRQKATPVSPSS